MSTSSTEDQEEEPLPPAVPLSNLKRARSLLHRLGKRPLKGLGQHFLVDTGVLGRIVDAAQLTSQDVVIEVGPGLGVLTQELARRAASVIAVELDAFLVGFLRKELAGYNNVSIVQADILKTDPANLLKEQGIRDREQESRGDLLKEQGTGDKEQEARGAPAYKVVANLPYNIASPVLRQFLEARAKPGLMVVMVQREVARRIVARPGKMSQLSVGIQLYGRPSIVHTVSPRSFFPPPKVHSAVVRIEVFPRPAVDLPPEALFRVVRAGFSQPRKQLRNSLAAGLGLAPGDAFTMLAKAGIAPQRRAETLSLEEWADLTIAAGNTGFREELRPGGQ